MKTRKNSSEISWPLEHDSIICKYISIKLESWTYRICNWKKMFCGFINLFCIYSLSHIHGLWLRYWRDRMLIPGVPISHFSTGVHSKFENVTLWSSMKQMPWHPVIASSQLILMSGPPMICMIILEKSLNKGYINKREHTSYYNHLPIDSNFLSGVKLKSWVILKNCNSWMMKCVLDENLLDFRWLEIFW